MIRKWHRVYNYDGKKVNDTRRVTNITRNGLPVKDTDEFLLIVNRLDSTKVPEMFTTQAMTKLSAADTRAYFKKYMQKQSECGTLGNLEDNNWDVKYSGQYNYVLKTGSGASDLIGQRSWIKEKLDSSEDFDYYRAELSKKSTQDTSGPDLNLAALNEIETNHPVRGCRSGNRPLRYCVPDLSAGQIQRCLYRMGTAAKAVENGYISCDKNSFIRFVLSDGNGNTTIRYIRINNINEGVWKAPR